MILEVSLYEMDFGLRIPKAPLAQMRVQQFMDRGQYLRCYVFLISHPTVQCSNRFGLNSISFMSLKAERMWF